MAGRVTPSPATAIAAVTVIAPASTTAVGVAAQGAGRWARSIIRNWALPGTENER